MRAVNVARSPVIVHLDVAPFHPTHVLQRFPERRNAGLSLWIALGKAHQHTDPPHPAGLLRAHRERPNARCDGQTADEISTIKPTARHVFSPRCRSASPPPYHPSRCRALSNP